ncbi:MAG: alpha-2-macroglobulin family protein [Thermodesulfobacteriota bacterium]
MSRGWWLVALGWTAVWVAAGSVPAAGAPAAWTGTPGPAWAGYDALLAKQRYEEAYRLASARLEAARQEGDSEDWTRALVRAVFLRTALHGYETAVRFLQEEPWPDEPRARTVLGLVYGQTLVRYGQAYSWEIRQRSQVVHTGALDLSLWTAEEIHAEAVASCLRVWEQRQALGAWPAAVLAEYLEPNTYPAGIRPSLRDAVSHLLAALLADSNGWSPRQANEAFALDLAALLGPLPAAAVQDPAAHPLTRIAAALADLEAWHQGRGEEEAALEACLERLRLLLPHFVQPEDRRQLQATLAGRLERCRHLPWWAAGMARLAEMLRDSTEPDRLAQARAKAQAGAAAYPDTVGGRWCQAIVQDIEAPAFELAAMATDAANRRSLGIRAKNLTTVHFRAYRDDLVRRVETARGGSLLPDPEEIAALVARDPDQAWSVELPAATDFDFHQHHLIPPLREPGFYLILASAPGDFADPSSGVQVALMGISDLVLLTRQAGQSLEVAAVSGASGQPKAGAEIRLYRFNWRQGHRLAHQIRTDAQGLATLTAGADHGSYLLLARHGSDMAFAPDRLGFSPQPAAADRQAALIYTDRAVYRPGQRIWWKVAAFGGRPDQGRLQGLAGATLTVRLRDANSQVLATTTVVANSFGTAAGELAIPAGRLLGRWQLEALLAGRRVGSTVLRVEEYKRPTFEARLLDPAMPLRLNAPATLAGEARYLFGQPVTGGEVRWRVSRQPLYPPWWERWGLEMPVQRPAAIVAAGTSRLDGGRFQLVFRPQADERLAAGPGRAVTYRYRVEAEITDEGGETRTAERTFRLGFVAVEGGIDLERGFLQAGEAAQARVRRTDLDGQPAPGEGRWHLSRLPGPAQALLPADQPLPDPADARRLLLPGDRLRPRWQPGYDPAAVLAGWPEGEVIASGDLAHGADGQATVALPALAAGTYRLRYETEDAYGGRFQTAQELVVAGGDSAPALPVFLKAERSSCTVGETCRLLVLSGLPDQPLVLERLRGGERVERRQLTPGRQPVLVELAVTGEDRGGFAVTLAGVRDHQALTLGESIAVPWRDRELAVSFASFRDRLQPGGQETWSVQVRTAGGEAAVAGAEVLAFMYDRALDLFAPLEPPSVLGLYPRRTGFRLPWTSLGPAATDTFRSPARQDLAPPVLAGDRLRFLDGYGIGGPGLRRRMMAADSAAMVAAAPAPAAPAVEPAEAAAAMAVAAEPAATAAAIPLRSDFAETAFWQPQLKTNADGTVALTFTVPDSVTSWQAFALAMTRDLQGGAASLQVASVKDLMVRPYLPRFFREGDRVWLPVLVNNASTKELAGQVRIAIQDQATGADRTASFGLGTEEAAQAFQAPAGGAGRVEFPVQVPSGVGDVVVTVTATAGSFSDGELRPVPLLPGRMHLAQSRFAVLKDATSRELSFPDLAVNDDPTRIQEALIVTLDAQLYLSLLSALPYLVDYPYQCTEQTLNRYLATGLLTSLYRQHPAVAAAARAMSGRDTRLEPWIRDDPNRTMRLEELPWLQVAQGGAEEPDQVLRLLEPSVAEAVRASSLARLLEAQTASGGFPWFPGGPPSPYMTLYLLAGFAKGLEFGVEAPREAVVRAWGYLRQQAFPELVERALAQDCCWEMVTYTGYVLARYPDLSWTGGTFSPEDQQRLADFSFRHWRQHAPLLKGCLALTLTRLGRGADARTVWASVLDAAKTSPDQGTFWAPEERAWLWYNDTVETQAQALATTLEVTPDDPRLEGLALWLVLNRKLNHWKSTRATSEAIYALTRYLERTGAFGVREEARVQVGGQSAAFVFEPERYTGRANRLSIPGEKIDPASMHRVEVAKTTPGWLLASATWHFSTEALPAEATGDYLEVSRTFFRRTAGNDGVRLAPLAAGDRLAVGDEVEVHLAIRSRHPMEYVHLRDPRPAGFEPASLVSRHQWDLGLGWYEEVRDSGTSFFIEALPQGEYVLKHRLRAALAGTFKAAPAVLSPMYAPELVAYSAGAVLSVTAPASATGPGMP